MKKIAYVARCNIVNGDSFDVGAWDTYHEAETRLRQDVNYATEKEYARCDWTIDGYLVPVDADVCDVYDYVEADEDPVVCYDFKKDKDEDPWVFADCRELYEHSIFKFDGAWFDEMSAAEVE